MRTQPVRRPQELVFNRSRLTVVSGPDAGTEQQFDVPEISIGTAPGNSLLLRDTTVSRHHCDVVATPQGFLLRDVGSTNGTELGGYLVQAAILRSGATFVLGQTTIRFEMLADEVREPLGRDWRFGRLLGSSPAMLRLFTILPRIAGSDSTVLLLGETGTGKGLLAEVIHEQSSRAGGPFVVVDCGSIPPTLIESELFGHEKGAFTGAVGRRAGAFEAASRGTVFLDEIGELPLDLQPKLLRALEERQIRRVGSTETVRLDIRVIAATSRDLRRAVNAGAFRSDLFYRLNVVGITVPPLRERREDVPLLVVHFWEQFRGEGAPLEPPPELLQALANREWPGNVRELRAAVERALVLGLTDEPWGDAEPIDREPGPAALPDPSVPFRVAKERATRRWERAYLEALLRAHGGNVSGAARAARMDRNYLRDLIRRHGLSAGD